MKINNSQLKISFNNAPSTVMHVDINSCFATIEQQANPGLRGRPVAVAAYVEDHGCILAASKEAKTLGIKTGMRVRDGKFLYPKLVVLPPDPNKYRFVNHQLLKLLSEYSPDVSVESIDEMVMKIPNPPAGEAGAECQMINIAQEIKQKIKKEIGEWITVSIGIAPNRYLAKVASGLHKPDGLDIITRETITDIFQHLKLEDLCGIKTGNSNRLRVAGIYTPMAMLAADADRLENAFHSIVGYYWWQRLHGYDPSTGSGQETFSSNQAQKSFGQSYALGHPYRPQEKGLHQILAQLVMKMGRRLRKNGFTARGMGVSTLLTDYTYWHSRETYEESFYADNAFYHRLLSMLIGAPKLPVRILAVWTFRLEHNLYQQGSLLESDTKEEHVTRALDAIHDRWGDFVVTSGRMLNMNQRVLDRIAFGKVRGVE
jgi:DNA polymerase IV